MRKVGVFLLSVILLVSLIGLALSVSSSVAITHPQKVKNWLNQSNVYGAFVTDAINQAKRSAGDDSGSGSNGSGDVSLSDAAVQQIARSTFSSTALQSDVDTFVNSNYDWLKGKSATPDFKIDLTSAKQTFADKVGNYVQTYMTSLPVCTDTQLSEMNAQGTDPLDLTCRPAGVLPATVASQVSDSIANSNAFLSNPIITATNLDPKGSTQMTPYYQNLSGLPKVYQFGTKIPLIAGVIALASLLGVIFLAKRHRNGLRVTAVVLALAGVLLVVANLLSDQVTSRVQRHVLSSSTGEVHKALATFVHYVTDQLAMVNLWFGVGYLVIAAIILVVLRATRHRQRTAPAFLSSTPSRPGTADLTAADVDEPQPVSRQSTAMQPQSPQFRPAQSRPIGRDDELRLKRQTPPTAPAMPQSSAAPKRRKPPKLIQ